jgi:hypothetical protein
MGVTIQRLRMTPPGWQQQQQPQERPVSCFAVMQDKVVVGPRLDRVKSVIRNDRRETSPLRQSKEFRRLLGRTIETPDAILLVDGEALARYAEGQMEEAREAMGRHLEEAEMPPGMEGQSPEEMLGPEPPWDLMRRYATSTLAAARWVEEGLRVRAWSPNPEGVQ